MEVDVQYLAANSLDELVSANLLSAKLLSAELESVSLSSAELVSLILLLDVLPPVKRLLLPAVKMPLLPVVLLLAGELLVELPPAVLP